MGNKGRETKKTKLHCQMRNQNTTKINYATLLQIHSLNEFIPITEQIVTDKILTLFLQKTYTETIILFHLYSIRSTVNLKSKIVLTYIKLNVRT